MVSYVHRYIVGSRVPRRFALHFLVHNLSVDFQSFEGYVTYLPFLIVSIDETQALRQFAVVAYVTEGDILDTTSWSSTIFLIVAHLYLCDASLFDLLDTDIIEDNVAYKVIIAAVYGETTLVVNLWLSLAENINIFVAQVLDGVATFSIAMNANEDWVGNISPKGGVTHRNISCAATKPLTCSIGRSAVVAITTEYAVEENVGASAENI